VTLSKTGQILLSRKSAQKSIISRQCFDTCEWKNENNLISKYIIHHDWIISMHIMSWWSLRKDHRMQNILRRRRRKTQQLIRYNPSFAYNTYTTGNWLHQYKIITFYTASWNYFHIRLDAFKHLSQRSNTSLVLWHFRKENTFNCFSHNSFYHRYMPI
jgi:hypothetical protein